MNNNHYLPSNLLWVAKEANAKGLEQRNFKELGALYSPKAAKAKNATTNGNTTTVSGLTFIHDKDQTIGSVFVPGLDDNLTQPLKSDRVYHIAKLSTTP